MNTEPNFDQFLAQYRKLHPANIPARRQAVSRYPGWLRIAVGAMFIAAGLISAVHTIPTVYNSIEANGVIPEGARILAAVLSPVAVELAILIAAYAFQNGSRVVVGSMLTVAFGVALVSNISSSIRAFDKGGDTSSTFVGIALGIGLPLIALVAGILFSNIYEAFTDAETAADAAYRAECLTFDAAVREAWDGHLLRLEARRQAEAEREAEKERQQVEEERAEARRREARETREAHRREKREIPVKREISPEVHELPGEKGASHEGRVNLREVAHRVHESGEEKMPADEMMRKYGISLGGTSKVRQLASTMNGNSEL